MGAECPNGHGRQNIVVLITPDGSNPRKMSDVVAWKLACGCVVGGAEYEQFKEAVATIELNRAVALRRIEEDVRKKKAAAYTGFVMKGG
jgi:hypothetical protein